MRAWPAVTHVTVSRASLAAAGMGAVMLGVAAGFTPAAWPAVIAGAAALVAALPGRWPAAGTLAAVAALVTTGIGITSRILPLAATVAEGTLVLAYLVALDHAESHLTRDRLPWLRGRAMVLAAGIGAALLTAAVAAVSFPATPWLAVAGAVAAGATLLAAVV